MTRPIKRQWPLAYNQYTALRQLTDHANMRSIDSGVRGKYRTLWGNLAVAGTALLDAMECATFVPATREGEDRSKYQHRVEAKPNQGVR